MLDGEGWQKFSDFPEEKEKEYVLIDGLKSRFEMHNIEGDGNCLFRAISYVLYGTENKHETIRNNLLMYIIQNKYQEIVQNIIIGSSDGNDRDLTYEEQYNLYVNKMRTSNYWGNAGESVIITNLLNIDIILYDMKNRKHEYKSVTRPPKKTIYLYYCAKEPKSIRDGIYSHFNVLELKPQPPQLSPHPPQIPSQLSPQLPQHPPLSSPSELEELQQKIFELEQRREKILQELNASQYGENDYLRVIPNNISREKKTKLIELLNTYDFSGEPREVRGHIINDTKYKKFILDCILDSYFPYLENKTNEKMIEQLWAGYKKNLEKNDILTIHIDDGSRVLFYQLLHESGIDNKLIDRTDFHDFVIRYLYKYINDSINDIKRLNHTEKEQLKGKARNIIFNDRKLKTSDINVIKNEVTKFIVKEYINIIIIKTVKYLIINTEGQEQIKAIITRKIDDHEPNNIDALINNFTKDVIGLCITKYIDNTINVIDELSTDNKEVLKKRTIANCVKDHEPNVEELKKNIDTFIGNETIHLFIGGKNKTAKQDYFKLISMYK